MTPRLPVRKETRREYVVALMAGLVAVMMTLSPMIDSGFYSDDVVVSSKIIASTKGLKTGLLAHMLMEMKGQLAIGHVTLSAVYYPFVYHVTDNNPVLYKLLIMMLVTANVALCVRFIHKVTGSVLPALAALAVFPVLFQFRSYHDPILSFFGYLQIVLLLLLGSLWFLDDYLRRRKPSLFGLSLATYFFCLWSYEISFLFFVLPVALVVFRSGDRRASSVLRLTWPFLLLSALFVAVGLVAGMLKTVHYEGTALRIEALTALVTIVKQVYATIPFTNFIHGTELFHEWLHFFKDSFNVVNIVLIGCYCLLLAGLFREARNARAGQAGRTESGACALLLIFGVFLIVIPAVPVSVSLKYQKELHWGIGYIPVYVSSFGCAFVAAALITWVLQKEWSLVSAAGRALLLLGGILLTVCSMVNHANNRMVVAFMNHHTHAPQRTLITEAVRDGLFYAVPFGASLYLGRTYDWEENEVYAKMFYRAVCRADRLAEVFTDEAGLQRHLEKVLASGPEALDDSRRRLYYLTYDSLGEKEGYAIAARLRNVPLRQADRAVRLDAEEIFVYLRHHQQNRTVNLDSAPGPVETVAAGPDWKLYRVNASSEPLNLRALVVDVSRGFRIMERK